MGDLEHSLLLLGVLLGRILELEQTLVHQLLEKAQVEIRFFGEIERENIAKEALVEVGGLHLLQVLAEVVVVGQCALVPEFGHLLQVVHLAVDLKTMGRVQVEDQVRAGQFLAHLVEGLRARENKAVR